MKAVYRLILLTLCCLLSGQALAQNQLQVMHKSDKIRWSQKELTSLDYLRQLGGETYRKPTIKLTYPIRRPYRPISFPIGSQYYAEANDTTRKGHKNRLLRVSIAPAILMGMGLFTYKDDGLLNRVDFRDVWNTIFPDFNDDVDDIAQYYPPVLVYIAKLSGLQGRSSIGRATTALSISAFLAGSTVYGLKQFINEPRPETTLGQSFPSGHTTTAFVGATFIHKELGVISPVYSVVGYTLATIVGVYRQLNDLHWISDVLFGAGLGIMSTELGYMITDDIYGNRGLNPSPVRRFFDKPMYKPSFLMYKLAYAQLFGDVDEIQDLGFNVRSGFSFGNEVTYFFNSWLGVGAEVAIGSFPINTANYELDNQSLEEVSSEVQTDAIGVFSAYFGPYFNFNLKGNNKISLIYKAAVGYTEGADAGIKIKLEEQFQENFDGRQELAVLSYIPDRAFGFGTSVFLRYLFSRVIGMTAYVNYNYSNPVVEVTQVNSVNPATGAINDEVIFDDEQRNQFFSVGVSIVGMLWGGNFGN